MQFKIEENGNNESIALPGIKSGRIKAVKKEAVAEVTEITLKEEIA